jgi:hypothetical protein
MFFYRKNISILTPFLFFIFCSFCDANGQALSYVDPASAYQRVLLEKGDGGTYQQIGTFKVTGTSYLFGEKLKGAVFAGKESGSNISLSYNTYTQELDIYTNGSSFAILKPAIQVDSFLMQKPADSKYMKEDLFFYGSHILDPSLKPCFLQVLLPGKRFSLLKAYNSGLDIVTTNYIQSDLRQFSLEVNYYFYDAEKQTLQKIKMSRRKVAEAFKAYMDVSDLVRDDFGSRPEENLKEIIGVLNKN